MTESEKAENLQRLIAEARTLIAAEVSYACRKYNHAEPPNEVQDLSGQIVLLLLEDNCRRLKTYDPAKAKFSTWLRQVIRHHVSSFFQNRRASEAIEELSENQIQAEASQEREILRNEERALLYAAIRQLTPHDQSLVYLKLSGATDQEIAQAMSLKVRSVQQEWSRLVKKLKTILKKMGRGLMSGHIV